MVLEECLQRVSVLPFKQAVDPGTGGRHMSHRNLERRDTNGVFEVDLVGLARHPSTEPQIAGEGFGAIPMIALQSCSQRSSLAGSPGSRTISSAKWFGLEVVVRREQPDGDFELDPQPFGGIDFGDAEEDVELIVKLRAERWSAADLDLAVDDSAV